MNNTPESTPQSSPIKRALLEIRELRARLTALEAARTEPIAIVGMACRLPGGAHSPADFWQLLAEGRDAITEVPAKRWDAAALYDPDPDAPGKTYARWGGFVEQVDAFDAPFFGISPREAMHMDPQQRLLLEVTWEAIEDAGLPAPRLSGSQTGVFMGMCRSEYGGLRSGDLVGLDVYSATGTLACTAVGRLSYTLDLRGPNVAVDTACSSSLAAIHLACQSLRSGESDLALAGGVSLTLSPALAVALSQMRALAPDGRCKTFDASADGFVSSEGCGIVVLKRLSDAQRDGDRIHALIRGTAINQDGQSAGLTAPNGAAQQAVIRQALQNGRVDPAQVTYIEAHGTGTSIGDPIEVAALAATYGQAGAVPCAVGSAKANIGHLESAAGVTGLIKAVLAMQHAAIPANIHLHTLNPSIVLEGTRLTMPTTLQPWTGPRLAAVSSFGMSGTNAHVILEEVAAPPVEATLADGEAHAYLLPLSAKNPPALAALAVAYADFLATSTASLADICSTASVRRTHHPYRLAVTGRSHQELIQALQQRTPATSAPPATEHTPRLVFVFSGQGSHWVGMGRQLLQTESVFRASLEACDQALRAVAGWSLLSELAADAAHSRLHETSVAQPAIFALQVALAALWRAWGIEPAAIVGQSLGEVAAAHVAGVLTLEEAVQVVVQRSRLMQRVAGQGRTAVVGLPPDQAQQLLLGYEERVGVAGNNSPMASVLSGDPEVLEQIVTDLTRRQIFGRMLKGVDIAFHSPQMEPVKHDLIRALAGLRPQAATIPLYSTVLGTRVNGGEYSAVYWGNNLREPFCFAATIGQLLADGYTHFLEVSPHPVLEMAVQETLLHAGVTGQSFASLQRDADEQQALLGTLGALYTSGYAVDWTRLYPTGACVTLPAYPWQRQRYWLEGAATPLSLLAASSQPASAATPQPERFQDWLHHITWQPLETAAPAPPSERGLWLLFADAEGVAEGLKARLEAQGEVCVLVTPYKTNRAPSRLSYQIDLAKPACFQKLVQDIIADSPLPCRGIVHLWSLDTSLLTTNLAAASEVVYQQGCGSLLALVQALAQTDWPALPRLWVVTRGAQQVGIASETLTVASAPVIGLSRTIALEHPELRYTTVDLDGSTATQQADALFAALRASDAETEVALRGSTRYGARLTHWELPPAPATSELFHSDATYLITGGLGGIGLVLAHWMVERGARHLVLTGRRHLETIVAEETVQSLDALRAAGAQVQYFSLDVSNREQIEELIAEIEETLPPLRGVFHAAGVVDDSILLQMKHDQFQGVLAPKVAGSWNLHMLTRHMKLDHFVLFSSAATLLGSPGQGNYAAANAFLDALARYRQSQGLPALSINWGAWAEVGLATAQTNRGARLAERGLASFAPTEGMAAFEWLLRHDIAQVGVMPFDAQQWQQFYPGARTPYLSMLASNTAGQEGATTALSLREELLAVAPGQRRRTLLESYLREQVAQVLHYPAEQIAADAPFASLGFDSLIAVEFAKRVGADSALSLAATLIWTYPTIAALAEHLAERMGIALAAESDEESSAPSAAEAMPQQELAGGLDELLSRIVSMSDTEIGSLLGTEHTV